MGDVLLDTPTAPHSLPGNSTFGRRLTCGADRDLQAIGSPVYLRGNPSQMRHSVPPK